MKKSVRQSENQMLDKGRERFMVDDEKTGTEFKQSGQKLIAECHTRVAEEIRATVDKELGNPNAGRRPAWLEDIQKVDAEILAYLGLQSTVAAAGKGSSQTALLAGLGKRISLECLGADIDEVHFELNEKTGKRKRKAIPYNTGKAMRHKINAARKFAQQKLSLDVEEWDAVKCATVATPVYNAVMRSGVFVRNSTTRANKTSIKMGFTEEAAIAIENTKERLSWMRPIFEPSLEAPVAWENTQTGAYDDPRLAKLVPLVRGATPEQNAEINFQCSELAKTDEWPMYISALNALQSTPLAINDYVLEAVEWAWDTDQPIKKFPKSLSIQMPEADKRWAEMSGDERNLHEQNRRNTADRNDQIKVNRKTMYDDLACAKEMQEAGTFYLAWNFDFRQRVYPVPHFNYHRDDHIKAMFTLANKKPLSEDNLEWLMLHIANCGDFHKISKQSHDDRQFWAGMNIDLMYQSGKDFRKNAEHWMQADKPFQYLAGCREYYLYRKAQDRGEQYFCGLPISLDGSNSGVQHYAAASLNEHDGALVNLVPNDKPADVYQVVADKVNEELENRAKLNIDQSALAKLNAEEAQAMTERFGAKQEINLRWLSFGVDRSIVKRPVMTYCYSSKVYGFHQQIFDDLMSPLEYERLKGTIAVHPFGSSEWEQKQAAMYLAKIVFAAVEQTISSAKVAMDYFQSVAGALANERKSVRWSTPTGFPVHQRYLHYTPKKIKPFLFDAAVQLNKRTQVSIRQSDGRVDKKKMKAAISPNIIHSLDAAHLLLTINHCQDQGVQDFFVIHDSFGCNASDTRVMYESVREVFSMMYTDYCFFSQLDREARSALNDPNNDTLLDIPPKGNLNLDLVCESNYCFS